MKPGLPILGKISIQSFYFFFHPSLLALYASIFILLFLPNYFQKYNAEIIDNLIVNKNERCYYHDMDNDGITEKITARFNNDETNPNITYYNNNELVIDQWNFKGTWMNGYRLFFGDYNHNGFEEVFLLTRYKDSIFLYMKELLLEDGLEINGRYICKAGLFSINDADINLNDHIMMDVDQDGYDECVFTINAGFSQQPRNTFIYYIPQDSMIVSPQSASIYHYGINYLDINNDGIKEITGLVSAFENIHYKMPYTDSCSWLMVIDPRNGANFLFEPIPFDGGLASSVIPVFYKLKNRTYIATTFYTTSVEHKSDMYWLKLFSAHGKLIREKQLPMIKNNFLCFLANHPENESFYLMDRNGNTYTADTNLNIKPLNELKSRRSGLYQYLNQQLDIDGDKEKEILLLAKIGGINQLLIYRNSLKEIIELNLQSSLSTNYSFFSLKKDEVDIDPILVLQSDNMLYFIKYGKSKYYYLKWPAYLFGYLLLVLIFWSLQNIQARIAKRKFETERQLIRQQLTISKNQLEPHFLLNVLNNLGSMFLQNNKQDAQYYFGKFTSLIHQNLEFADKIEISLAEELKFVEDYLALQKKRMNGELTYAIDSDVGINLKSIKIPHSLVFTFVENAIKHGLFPKTDNRVLEIRIQQTKRNILITITDNGIGREQSKAHITEGTGKGLMITQNIISSFNKLTKKSISYQILDLYGENGIGLGTEIRINI